jgi:hypothetical protein
LCCLDTGFGYDVLIRADDRTAHPAVFAAWLRGEVMRV